MLTGITPGKKLSLALDGMLCLGDDTSVLDVTNQKMSIYRFPLSINEVDDVRIDKGVIVGNTLYRYGYGKLADVLIYAKYPAPEDNREPSSSSEGPLDNPDSMLELIGYGLKDKIGYGTVKYYTGYPQPVCRLRWIGLKIINGTVQHLYLQRLFSNRDLEDLRYDTTRQIAGLYIDDMVESYRDYINTLEEGKK